MFYHLKGTITDIEAGLAVVDCGGVGYAVNVSANTIAALHAGSEAKLYITEQIREDAFDLYGFASRAEQRCFLMLTSVSGVGPKAALSILSSATAEQVCMAILNGEERVLTAAPGVGKRIAQRVILELKDKLSKDSGFTFDMSGAGAAPAAGGSATGSKLSDAAAALMTLGYTASEAAAALKNVDAAQSLEDIIRAALRGMTQ